MEKAIRKNIRKYLENLGWIVYDEFYYATGRCRFDIYALREGESLIIELKNNREYTTSDCGYLVGNQLLYEILGQALWYSQFADELWLVVPVRFKHKIERIEPTFLLDTLNIKCYSSSEWLND